jgi:small neutral amino acid transporter SnatA (MarC family)
VVALGVILARALFGRVALSCLGVQPALEGAGGLLLPLVALEPLTGKAREPTDEKRPG